jgi:hypothetical protein
MSSMSPGADGFCMAVGPAMAWGRRGIERELSSDDLVGANSLRDMGASVSSTATPFFADSSFDADGSGGNSDASGAGRAALPVAQADSNAMDSQSLLTRCMGGVSAQSQAVAIGSVSTRCKRTMNGPIACAWLDYLRTESGPATQIRDFTTGAKPFGALEDRLVCRPSPNNPGIVEFEHRVYRDDR